MYMHIFEKASKLKLRFQTDRGVLTVEDLWDLPMTQLDRIAISLDKQINEAPKVSFVNKTAQVNPTVQLSFDIVKTVIDYRLADKERREKSLEIKTRKEKLLSLIAQKQDEQLTTKSVDELTAELNSLYAQDTDEQL